MSTTTAPTNTSQQSGSYVARSIDITLTLGNGTFGQTGFNTVKLSGLRVVASILKAGSPSFDRADIRVYGVPPSVMNAVSTLGIPVASTRVNNTMTVAAGDSVNGMSIVYSGTLNNAWQNLDGAPETFLNLSAAAGQILAMQPISPTSIAGTADVATLISNLAIQSGWGFENDGVTAKLPPSYFPGTAMDQIHAIARAANIEVYFDSGTPGPGSPVATPGTGTVSIWPKTGTRGGQIPLISAGTGLVGYPQYNDQGMGFRCIFNPNIRLGGLIKMQSVIGGQPAPANATTAQQLQSGPNGEWYVRGPLTYDLAAQVPGGPWFTNVVCSRVQVP